MKRPDGTIDFNNLAPEVAETVRRGQRRQAERSMSKAQRRQAARIKVTIDVPEDLKLHLERIAAELSVPLSQVYRWMILRGLDDTTMADLQDARKPSRSMRYEFILFSDDASPKGQP